MRQLLIAVLLFLVPTLVFAEHAHIQPEEEQMRSYETTECRFKLPDDHGWTEAEQWAWGEICLSRISNMSKFKYKDDGKGCNPKEVEDWPEHRNLSATFIELITTQKPWSTAPADPIIFIECARILEIISLSRQKISPSLWLDKSLLAGGFNLSSAKLEGTLSLDGSVVNAPIYAYELETKSDIFLRNSRFKGEVRMSSAKIGGQLFANGSTFDAPIYAYELETKSDIFFHNSRFKGEVRMSSAKIGDQLSVNGSTFDAPIYADGLEAKSSITLHNSRFKGKVRIGDAKIGGKLSANGSTFDALIHADGLEAKSAIILRNGRFKGTVRMIDAKIGGQLAANGSTFSKTFIAEGLEVKNSIFLSNNSNFKKVSLINAKIGGNLSAAGSTFSKIFIAGGLEVKNSIFLSNNANFKEVNLLNAKIGGDLRLNSSTYNGEVDLTGATVEGEISLWKPGTKDINWNNNATLILRNAHAGSLQASKDSWERDASNLPVDLSDFNLFLLFLRNARAGSLQASKGSWGHDANNLPVDLSGFNYAQLGGLQSHKGNTMETADAEWLINWIESPKPDGIEHDDHYVPQPYEHLARVLNKMGATDKAKAVRYAKFEHGKRTTNGWWKHLGYDIANLTIGYGIYPFRLLWLFAGLVLIGVPISYRSIDMKCMNMNIWDRLWYSLENALPLIELSDEHKKICHNSFAKHFFHIQKILGFIIATVIVGALSLLGGQSS